MIRKNNLVRSKILYARYSPMTLSEKLADIEVLDPEGATHRLGDAWQEQPVVLLFIRHFG